LNDPASPSINPNTNQNLVALDRSEYEKYLNWKDHHETESTTTVSLNINQIKQNLKQNLENNTRIADNTIKNISNIEHDYKDFGIL